MLFIYSLLLCICFIFIFSNYFKVENFISSYFTISFISTIIGHVIVKPNYLLKIANLYDSTIIIGSIFGIFINTKYYKYLVLITQLCLIFISLKLNIDFHTNTKLIGIEILFFIIIAFYSKLFKKIYFYLFVILLSTTFINDFWMSWLYEIQRNTTNFLHEKHYYTFSGIYLITFYAIFIIYHVKFRINK